MSNTTKKLVRQSYLVTQPEARQKLMDALALGMSDTMACHYSNVSTSTLSCVLERAKIDLELGKENTDFVMFLNEYNEAKARFVNKNMKIIQSAALEGNWSAAAWLLERRCPKDFAPNQQLNVEGLERVSIKMDVKPVMLEDGK